MCALLFFLVKECLLLSCRTVVDCGIYQVSMVDFNNNQIKRNGDIQHRERKDR